MLRGDAAHRPLQRGNELDLLRHLRIVFLRRARHRDCVLNVGELAGEDAAIVRRRIPRENLRRLGLLVQLAHVLHGFDRALRVQDDVAGFILLRAAE